MEAILIILSILLIAGGIIFSILPPLPGPLLTYGALLCANSISAETEFSITFFVSWGIIGVLILVADYLLPIAATKKFGGTKAGVIGGMIGMAAGILLPIPFGIIVGPFFGAIFGDLYGGNAISSALKSGFASFIGFVVATVLKLFYSVALGVVIIIEVGSFGFRRIIEMF